MRHVRNRSCGCEVNMLDARSLHTETKGSNSPSPPQTGGPKVDESRTQRDERAVHQHPDTRNSLEALGVAPALAALHELVELLEDLLELARVLSVVVL